MPARVAIRRLLIRGLAPRDHPAPGELEQRLTDAARGFLPGALEDAVRSWSGDSVLRIRRLEVDVTVDGAFEPRGFANLLARAVAQQLRSAMESGASHGGSDGVVLYASRAIYLAALLEALAEERARERWWLSDAEGLRFLAPAQAIRTALLADVRVGLEALASLPMLRRMAVIRTLTPVEANRTLIGLADAGVAADVEPCLDAIVRAAAELPEDASALALFVGAFAWRPVLAGPALAATARLWAQIAQARRSGAAAPPAGAFERSDENDDTTRRLLQSARALGAATMTAADARRVLAAADAANRSHAARSEAVCCFTQFGGLLLLLPDLGAEDIADAAADMPDAAAVLAYAALGMCAGRARFADWLCDGLWRELLGLDARSPASALTGRLGAVPEDTWSRFKPLLATLDRRRDARFLLAPRSLAGSRQAAHVLAGLARAASKRFARRLVGFGEASAPFLWANVLATTAVLERHPGGWSARLSRPPLDVLLSLGRIAEGGIFTPSGARVEIARTSS
jgi:hypothetical protein